MELGWDQGFEDLATTWKLTVPVPHRVFRAYVDRHARYGRRPYCDRGHDSTY